MLQLQHKMWIKCKYPEVIEKLGNQLIHFTLRLPIHHAAKHGVFNIAVELLEKNSDQTVVDAQDVHGR